MAKTKISEFSSTPANNTDIDSINIAEGCAPSGINDAIRELMAQLKDFQTGAVGDSFNGPIGTSTAAAGAFTTLSASSTTTLSGLTASTALALDASKNVVSVANTGSGSNVLSTSPTLVTPILGTPTSATLTNATGLPIATGVSGLGTGVATFLATPSSANLRSALTDETGTGSAVFATSPTLVTPVLGTPTSATLTNATGLPLTTGVTGTLPTANGGTNLTSFTSGGVVYASSTSALATGSAFQFNGTDLGLGVTPSVNTVSGSGYRQIEVGTSVGNMVFAGGNELLVVQNAIYNSGFKYAQSTQASYFRLNAGGHQFFTAPSGTAGNAISFTQAMTLTAGGSLGVGTTNPVVYGGSAFTKIVNIGSLNSISAGFSDESTGTLRIAHATNQNIINFDTTALCFQSGGTSSPTERARIDSSGNLLVGTTSNLGGLGGKVQIDSAGSRGLVQSVNANVRLQEYLVSGSTVGFISTDGTNTTYSTSSDYRLKNTIAPMTGALAKVALLKPCTYKWNADNSDGEGFIAHELAEVVPQCVTGKKDAVDENGNPQYQGIDTSFLVATLTAAIQEQQALIVSLKARLDAANL